LLTKIFSYFCRALKLKYLKNIHFAVFLLLLACLLSSCSSGEYELEQYKVDYVEKTIKRDTLGKSDTSRITEQFRPGKYVYVVQIGAFTEKSNFERFFAKATEILGNDVYNVFIDNLYKIRIGKFIDNRTALNLLEKVKSLGYNDAFIITTKQ
jgi:sporulation related protein